MTAATFDRSELREKLTKRRSAEAPQQPENGVSTPSPERVKEAVREAHDPKRLVSEPQNWSQR